MTQYDSNLKTFTTVTSGSTSNSIMVESLYFNENRISSGLYFTNIDKIPFVYYTNTNNTSTVVNEYKNIKISSTYSKGDSITDYYLPTMNFKYQFNSSDIPSDSLSTIRIDFKSEDTQVLSPSPFEDLKQINFKFQIGSNDFTNYNIPNFTSYKIYGKLSIGSTYEDITEMFYYTDLDETIEQKRFYNFNYTYNYLEGVESYKEYSFSYLMLDNSIINDFYSDYYIELNFDNVVNFYSYFFDNTNNTEYSFVPQTLTGYTRANFYSLGSLNYLYFYENTDVLHRLYMSFNSTIVDDSYIQYYIYNYNTNKIISYLTPTHDLSNYYYSYLDFNLSNNEVLVAYLKSSTDNIDNMPVYYNIANLTLIMPNFSGNVVLPNGSTIDKDVISDVISNNDNLFNIYDNAFNSFKTKITEFLSLFSYVFSNLNSNYIGYFIVAFGLTIFFIIVKMYK